MSGACNPKPELRAAVLRELATGATRSEIARRLGVTKNAVQGHIARAGLCDSHSKYNGRAPVTTMLERLEAMHRRMDAVLAWAMPILKADRDNWRANEAKILAAKLKAKRAKSWAA